jgi:hypothetical protein
VAVRHRALRAVRLHAARRHAMPAMPPIARSTGAALSVYDCRDAIRSAHEMPRPQRLRQSAAVIVAGAITRLVRSRVLHSACLPQGIGSHITNLDASKVMAYLMKKNMTVFVMVEPFNVEGRMQNHLCVRLAVNIFHDLEQFEALAEAINSLDGRYTGLKMAQEVLDFSGTA